MSLLKCSLSGETPPTDPVVTLSGHVCSRRLLLTKLTENGGVDPFDTSSNPRALDESDLIELHVGGNAGNDAAAAAAAPPRLPAATSLPALLRQVQTEHDALLLELYDTRRVLEETRRELSQALYQNDAAVRVVARLVMERDGAREQLAAGSAQVEARGGAPAAAPADEERARKKPRRGEGEAADAMEVDATENNGDVSNKIPPGDLEEMISLWKDLSKSRKKAKKAKGSDGDAPTALTVESLKGCSEMAKKSLHKSSAKAGILNIGYTAASGLLLTTGRDKQTVVYNVAEKKVVATLVADKGTDTICSDILTATSTGSVLVATGATDGTVRLYIAPSATGDFSPCSTTKLEDQVVSLSIQPTGKYVLAATKAGKVSFLALRDGNKLEMVASFGSDFDSPAYTCGALHPDGLIYLTGNASGEIDLWDLKGQARAGKMTAQGGQAITSIAVSSNGYHFASATMSGTVQVWDLRKFKCVGVLNANGSEVGPVKSVAFSPADGKILAYGGANGTATIVAVKDWDNKATLVLSKPSKGKSPETTGLAWIMRGGLSLATCSDADRPVRFWGLAADEQ